MAENNNFEPIKPIEPIQSRPITQEQDPNAILRNAIKTQRRIKKKSN